MQVKYTATIEKKTDHDITWSGDDSSVFDKVANSDTFNKEIYFYPSTPPESVWLWVLGHEKSSASKKIIDRLWRTRWVFHMCVGGKGYYNDQPIKRGTCFLTWPYFKHSIVADSDDPFEFYWLILRGEDVLDFVHQNGCRKSRMVFETNCVDELQNLFQLGLTADYTKVDVYKYTMALVNMIFSYYRMFDVPDEGDVVYTEHGKKVL
jgi:hypothetical protein